MGLKGTLGSARSTRAAANVAGLYAALRDDIKHGTRRVAGFDHAVMLTRLTEQLLATDADGYSRVDG